MSVLLAAVGLWTVWHVGWERRELSSLQTPLLPTSPLLAWRCHLNPIYLGRGG